MEAVAAMTVELALSGFSVLVTLALGVLVFVTNRRANLTSEKKLTVDEQIAEDEREDVIAKRRREELDRLYLRVEALERETTELRSRVETAEAETSGLRSRAELSERQTFEMIHHIVLLEQMIPDPPGPPQRPDWKLPILTDRP